MIVGDCGMSTRHGNGEARPLETSPGLAAKSGGLAHLADLPVADGDAAVHAGGEVHIMGGDEGREARLDQSGRRRRRCEARVPRGR